MHSTADNALQFENVCFAYQNDEYLFDNITLKIKKGDFVALLGHNGAGKSTLIKLALGILKPQKGEVRIMGEKVDLKNKWNKVGYIQQLPENLDSSFPATVEELILLGRLPWKKGLLKNYDAEDRKKVHEAAKAVGIDNLLYRKIGELSGGQRQKVFIAKVLAADAEVLILDEPVSAVDYKAQHAFYDLIQDLNKNHGLTILLISHDIGQILQHAKRIVLLNRGIVFDGNSENFTKQDYLELTEKI